MTTHEIENLFNAAHEYLSNTEEDELDDTPAEAMIREIPRLITKLTEKDATIKKFEDDAMYWYREAEKARFMFLAAHDEHKRTRKALEDARDSIQVIEAHGERPWEGEKE